MIRNSSTAILGRGIDPDLPSLTPDAARSILDLTFGQADRERVDLLTAKNQEGSLSSDEQSELEEYLRASDLLAIFKSKARLSLKLAQRDG